LLAKTFLLLQLQRRLPSTQHCAATALVAGIFISTACSGGGGQSVIDAGNDDAGAKVCPKFLEFEALGDETRIDIGYTGLLHGGTLPSNSLATYRIDSCDDECRRCSFSGPVRADPARRPTVMQRCINDPRKECTRDSECGGGKCRFALRTVQNSAAGTCSLAYFEPAPGIGNGEPVQGVFDLVTGAANLTIANIISALYSGGICESCDNDKTSFDGVADGTCSSSGIACDVSGLGGVPPSNTSFDCPIPGPSMSAVPLPLTSLGSDTRTWSIDDPGRPDCTDDDGLCWCGLCEDFASPCSSDSDCIGIGSGQCGFGGVPGMEIKSRNNTCTTTCNYDPQTNRGTCLSPNGTVPCFPNSGTITAEGKVKRGDGFFITTLAGLDCYGASFTPIDGIFGLPGILYVRIVYRITVRDSP